MPETPSSFYRRVGDDLFDATEHTRGPWDETAQHGGPPSALLGHAIEQHEPRDGFRLARLTFEILGPVPIGQVRAVARVVRGGRSVELLEGALLDASGTERMTARAWRMRTSPGQVPEAGAEPPPSRPEDGHETDFFASMRGRLGYHTGMEFSFTTGAFSEPGPATAWFRMRVPLIEGEPPTPLQRLLVATDTGNGISAVLDPERYLFINTDVTATILRPPEGEWVCIDARTLVDPDGIGIAEAAVFDLRGRVGRATQSLFCAPRP